MGQIITRVTGGIEKRDINPDYQRFDDSPKDKLLGKSSLVHVIGELHEFCWLCADQVLVSFARYQTISHGLNALLVNNMLQPPLKIGPKTVFLGQKTPFSAKNFRFRKRTVR